ncbi:unnamed protein product [Diatraea saccharalis]|uniref:C2H2-type domain-containing protein n=1 Tax=Diatraea saccharalis TaxID=40085 RepID=A0A9N9R4T2_9NEOP|nr:unnamed protein product [Diatraea saccharalis]
MGDDMPSWTGPQGKRYRGRPLMRWQDEIVETASCSWIQKAQNRERWNPLEEAFTRGGITCVYDVEYKRLICDDCIEQLRRSFSFKTMVTNNERMLRQYLDSVQHYDASKPMTEVPLNVPVKLEALPEEDDNYHQDNGMDGSCSDNDVLADIKIESITCSTEAPIGTKMPKKRKSQERKVKMKKCKIKSEDSLNRDVSKDWSKIVERRGNGPLLRENSLKLLANSTICVFQWNKSRYRCFCCKEPFSDLNSLKDHTNSQHAIEDIEKKIILQQNRLVKVEVSSILCKLCTKQLNSLTDLRQHLKEHGLRFVPEEDLLVPFKINGQLQCQLCSENFSVFRLLNIHMNKHFQKQVCHICGTGFSNLVFLNLHKTRSHRPLTCKQCDLVFKSRSEKRSHDVNVHGVKFERKLRFPCPYCQERFFQENFRVQHLVEKHGMKKPEHKCSVCAKVFITKSLCNNHIKSVHMKEKSHECDICHNLFYTKSDVMRHRVTHTGEKKYACSVCNSPFATKDSLRRHMKRTHVVMN